MGFTISDALGFTKIFSDIYSAVSNTIHYWVNRKDQLEATKEASEENKRQFNESLDEQKDESEWQKENAAAQLDFANRQLNTQTDIANNNLALQQSQFDYQKQLNATQMQREDNAYQRAAADVAAAGLSPLSITGGASSSPLSSAPAPQMDSSGISAAAGQYMDFAKQYASLRMIVSGRKVDTRRQYSALQSGAKMALAQMANQAKLTSQSLATQAFNNISNYQKDYLEKQYLEEQIKSEQDRRDWNNKNGYRNQSLENALVAIAENLANRHTDTISHGVEKVQDTWNEVREVLDFRTEPKIPVEVLPDNAIDGGLKNSVSFYKNQMDALIKSKLGLNCWEDLNKVYQSSPYLKKKFDNFALFYKYLDNGSSAKKIYDELLTGKIFK